VWEWCFWIEPDWIGLDWIGLDVGIPPMVIARNAFCG
jgi:hypothetical protein